jgi:hypothetical protein
VAAVDRVYPNATTTLDELLGVPSEDRFGFDVPEVGGAMGDIGIRHDTTSRIVIGSFDGARVVSGSGTDVGTVVRDAEGRPMVTGPERIPFLLIVPEGADVTSLPVLVVGHGSPRTMMDGLAFADTLGAAGIAVLAFDAYQHGGRSPTAVDLLDPRGRPMPDGISEHDGMTVLTRIQGVQGVPAGMEASVAYIEGSFAQVHADAFSAIRFASEGDLSAIAAAMPSSRASPSIATRSSTPASRSARTSAAGSSRPSRSSTRSCSTCPAARSRRSSRARLERARSSTSSSRRSSACAGRSTRSAAACGSSR